MSRPLVAFPDAERATVGLLADLLADHESNVTVGVGVPEDWTPTSGPHIEVDWDGTPLMAWPAFAHATIRLIARAATTTEAKRLVSLAQGLLLAHNGGDGIAAILPLTGVLPARDPKTRAEIASVTVRVTVRSEPVQAGS